MPFDNDKSREIFMGTFDKLCITGIIFKLLEDNAI